MGAFDSDKLNTSKCRLTPEGGIAVQLTNRTGANSVKGTLVHPDSATSDGVILVPVNDADPIGVVYEAGIADGSLLWIVIAGIAEVYFVNGATQGQFARMCVTADTNDAPGFAMAEAVPTPPLATDKHFQEIGHVLQTVAAGNLARCIIHFN